MNEFDDTTADNHDEGRNDKITWWWNKWLGVGPVDAVVVAIKSLHEWSSFSLDEV